MPDHRSPLSWAWDDDSLLPKRDDYSEAEIHRMEIAAERRREQPVRLGRDQGELEGSEQ
jgi:hypothetical protein